MRIDSHQHFWQASRGDYGWLTPELGSLYRDYLPDDLRPLLQEHRIDKTVVVQAAPTVAETDFLLALAQRREFIAGVVGWLDMASVDFEDQFAAYRRKPGFIGIRPMLQDLPEDDYILKPQVLDSLEKIAAADFPFDFLVYTRHLPYVLQALERAPGLRAVIDHIAKPEIRARRMEPWKSHIRELAQYPNVYCKLSGMITEADRKNWKADDLQPYVEHVAECFGPQRLMFGSDWPVCLLAGTYSQVINTLAEILAPMLNEAAMAKILGENAARFYKCSDS